MVNQCKMAYDMVLNFARESPQTFKMIYLKMTFLQIRNYGIDPMVYYIPKALY